MMRNDDESLNAYLAMLHPLDEFGRVVAEHAKEAGHYHMQLSAAEARFLALLVKLKQPRMVVEFGCFMGFSAISMARAMPVDGRLITWEKNPNFARQGREHVAQAGLSERVTVMEGDARASLEGFVPPVPLEMVFIDADKAAYPAYLDWAEKHLVPGGLLVGDNTLLFGHAPKTTQPEGVSKAQWEGMRRFNAEVMRRFDGCLLPTIEGMVVALKR
ncbi:O-methyltransferase [bacterium]|nr:O-methyltransferase [bacterium]